MDRRTFLAGSCLGLLAFTWECGAEESVKLLATGSSTVAPLVAELARRFEQSHPTIRIDVQTGGSSRGVADARRGVVDFGMVSRALKTNESDLYVTTLANDGVSVIVHADNPVQALSRADLIALYRGEIDDWGRLGGKVGEPPVVVTKAAGRSTLELFASYLEMPPEELKAAIVIGDNQQGIKTVAGNPNAVGYVSIGAALQAMAAGTPIKVLPMNGIPATLEAVADGSFPISRPLNVVTRQPPNGALAQFLDFALAQAQSDIVVAMSFVPRHGQ